jgi:hypothetical protein
MADTGAPWNIPYAEPSDLVRDWPALSEDVAEAVAAGLTAAGNAGIGSNVVQTVKTDTFQSTSETFATVTGLTATITPTSATSKILVIANISISTNFSAHVRLSGGNAGTYIGDASGSTIQSASSTGEQVAALALQAGQWNHTLVYLDSPGVATATTYGVEIRCGTAGTTQINRAQAEADNKNWGRNASSITVIEVEA